MNSMARPKGRLNYSPEFLEQALLALAFTGRAKEARAQLVLGMPEGTKIPDETTLRDWQKQFSGRIAELREQHGAEIDRHTKSRYLDIMDRSIAVVMKLLDKTDQAIDAGEITGKDLPGALKSVVWTYAVTQDKKFLIEGKPTQIHGRDKGEIALEDLAKRYAAPVDSTVQKELTEGKEQDG
jgi:hypothetical protein